MEKSCVIRQASLGHLKPENGKYLQLVHKSMVRGSPRHQLGGSWLVIRRVVSRVPIIAARIRGLITPLTTTHEPSRISRLAAEHTVLESLAYVIDVGALMIRQGV